MDLSRARKRLPWILAALYALVAMVWFGARLWQGESLASLFFTADQRGQQALDRGDYAAAAGLFQDPLRRGVAFYLQGEFGSAVEQFRSLDMEDETAFFLLGNARAHNREYTEATAVYDRLLERDSGHRARRNRDRVSRILEEIRQRGTGGDRTGTGDETSLQKPILEEALLDSFDPEAFLRGIEGNELWLRQAEPDPGEFLRTKFRLQVEKSNPEALKNR